MTCGKILILSPHQCTEIFDPLNSISVKLLVQHLPDKQASATSTMQVQPMKVNALTSCMAVAGFTVSTAGFHKCVNPQLCCLLADLVSPLHSNMTCFNRHNTCNKYVLDIIKDCNKCNNGYFD